MIKSFFFIAIGFFGGLWVIWPGVASKDGWQCAKDIVLNADKESSDPQSFMADFERKLKLSSALSPSILLKSEELKTMEKLRIVGDACFRF